MKHHLVIRDKSLNGWQYGMLRSFERAIVEKTDAEVCELPYSYVSAKVSNYFSNGMKRGYYRKYFPKKAFDIKADVAWHILMGPENYRLDVFKNWNLNCKIKILYLFDTLPVQYELIKRLFSNNTWDILITSFNDAADDLTKITGRKWICIEQAADNDFFEFIPSDKRLIDFSSYGRKDSNLHEAVKGFCLGNGLYYDYTTHDAKHPIVEAEELYQQYIWHLKHSLFTISLPVELTNPKRAMHLNPITCRWFEAAAAGTIIVGRKPDNKNFDNQLCKNLVTEINLEYGNRHIYTQLEEIWKNRLALHEKAKDIVITNSFRWTWKNRVNTILNDILS